MWTHEQSYQGRGLRARVHRSRLEMIERLFAAIPLPDSGTFGDFGCSNAYILSLLQARFFEGKDWDFHGFDHAEALLVEGRKKALPRTELHVVDMTRPQPEWEGRFDVTMCLETLEHTADAHASLMTLYQVTRPGGTLLISIPNEKGPQGLVKLIGRPLVSRDPYGDFFEGKSRGRYVWHLLTGRRLDVFRGHSPDGWGPHLGFDWQVFEDYLNEALIEPGLCRLTTRATSFMSFNLFYQLEKLR